MMASSSSSDILADLTALVDKRVKAGDLDTNLNTFMEGEVVPTWRDNSPEDSGAYQDSVQVTTPARSGKGQVGATVDYAHIIEYGSEDTPEFAPRARTREHFTRP